MKRRYGEPRPEQINPTKPSEPQDLEAWFDRWFPDCPTTAREQLNEVIRSKHGKTREANRTIRKHRRHCDV
jgi:hypothetical protein